MSALITSIQHIIAGSSQHDMVKKETKGTDYKGQSQIGHWESSDLHW